MNLWYECPQCRNENEVDSDWRHVLQTCYDCGSQNSVKFAVSSVKVVIDVNGNDSRIKRIAPSDERKKE